MSEQVLCRLFSYCSFSPPPSCLQESWKGKCAEVCGFMSVCGCASLGQLQQCALTRGQVGDVARAAELEGDVLGCLQLPQLHEAVSCHGQRVGDEKRSLRITLRRDDGRLLLLLCLHTQNDSRLYIKSIVYVLMDPIKTK